MSEQDLNGLNGDVSPTDIYQFSSAEAQERAFKGKIKQLSGDTLNLCNFSFADRESIYTQDCSNLCNSYAGL